MQTKNNKVYGPMFESQLGYPVIAEVMQVGNLDEARAKAIVEIVLEAVFVQLVECFTLLTPPDEELVPVMTWEEFLEGQPLPGEQL